MPISVVNSVGYRALLLRAGFGLLCLAVMSCGGSEGPGEDGAINISPNTISFTTAPGGALDPKTVGVTPATVPLTGLSASLAYTGTPPNPWLNAQLGSTEATLESPSILTLEVTTTELPPGSYRATVTIEGENAGNAPRVTVTLTVEAAAAMALVTQPSAAAASGAALAEAPVVQLMTSAGDPVGQAGVEISVALEGGGDLTGPTTLTTDAEGQARFEGLTITGPTGPRTLLFTSEGLTEVRSNAVQITAGAAARLEAGSILSQQAEAGTPVNEPPVAVVTDAGGNPIAGVPVTFAVTEGGGTIDPTTPVITDAEGRAASASWVLGAIAGENAATATAEGLEGSPVTFAATGTNEGVVPGPVSEANSSVAASPGSFVAGSAGTAVTVTARDANNTLIGGATVTLASTGSDFAFGSTTLTTGTNGPTLGRATTTYTSTRAESKSISAEITAGAVTVSPDPANVTVTAGEPDGSTSTLTADPTTVLGLVNAAAGGTPRTSQIQATLRDVHGNPVSGRSVTMAITAGPGGETLNQPTGTTGGNGRASGSLSSSTGGTYTVQASVVGGATIGQTVQVAFLLTYTDDIEPLFRQSFPNALFAGAFTTPCSSCHVPYPNGVNSLPSLSFDQLTNLHESEQVVIPQDANNSLLVRALEHRSLDAAEHMPSSSQKLPEDVIGRIRRWIDQEGTLRQ